MGEGEEAGSRVGGEEGEHRRRRRGRDADATGKKGKRERGWQGGISRRTAVGRGAAQVLPARGGKRRKRKKVKKRRKIRRERKKISRKMETESKYRLYLETENSFRL